MKYELSLSHGLYNAGVLGLIRILENAGKSQFINISQYSDLLTIDSKAFENFEWDYYNFFKTIYGERTTTSKLINAYKILLPDEEDFEDKFKEWEKKYVTKINQKTGAYASAYTIVKESRNDSFNVIAEVKEIKKEKNSKERYSLYEQIINYLDRHRDVFMYKNIAYTLLDSYWGNISFFNSSKVKSDMMLEYKTEFVDTIEISSQNIDSSGKYECNECFTRFKKNHVEATGTWLSDVGVDYKRKPSHYWNYKVHEAVCPLCKLVYSCIPAGFFTLNRKGLFINVNSSVNDLIQMNSPLTELAKYETFDSYQEMSYGQILRHLNTAYDQSTIESALTNVQVIRREGSSSDDLKYHIDHLGQLQLNVLKECQRELNYYQHKYYEENDRFINLYTEVLGMVSNGENLYRKIAYFLRTTPSKGKFKKTMKLLPLLRIQTVMTSYRTCGMKGERNLIETNKKKVYVMYQKGIEMRKTQNLPAEELDNKWRGLVYQLTNALQAQNKEAFMDRILRLYTSQSKAVPTLFLEMLNDKEALMNYGYAYIIGLKGEEMNVAKEDN